MSTPTKERFNKSNPCPVCESGTKGCSVTVDDLHSCRGTPARPDEWKATKRDATWGYYRRVGDNTHRDGRQAETVTPPRDWFAEAAAYAAAMTPERAEQLAEALGLPPTALDAMLLIGFSDESPAGLCWTFPESTASGLVCGINRRFADGTKRTILQSKRGLSLTTNGTGSTGPVFVVEGASDVLAMTAAGLAAVGRFSNTGGLDLLAELFREFPADRPIVVMGENDQKPDGKWPGRDGVNAIAPALARKLGRVILTAYPPKGAKDVREWLTSPDRDESEWVARGQELSGLMMATAESVGSDANGDVPPKVAARPELLYRPFPIEALPPTLREFVTEVAASVDADPAFAALPALTVAGAAIGNSLVISPKRGFREPPLLWTCTVGDSGTGKSPCFKPSAELAGEIGKQLKARHGATVEEYVKECETWKRTAKKDRVPDEEPRPCPPREYFDISDVTIERLGEMVSTSPRGLIINRDELAGWIGSFKQYKGKSGGSDAPNWLSMFDAGRISYHRRTGEPRDVECDRAFVAVAGGIQPAILSDVLSDAGFIGSGMGARLMFAWPPKSCPRWSETELDPKTEFNFRVVLDAMRELPFDERQGPLAINLDANAKERFKALNDEFAETAEGIDGGPMAAVYPKAIRFALRLALIWHCVNEASEGRDPAKDCIGDEAMKAGETLARWFVHEAERVYAMAGEDSKAKTIRLLTALVRRKALGGKITVRNFQRTNVRKYKSAELAKTTLDTLVKAERGRWVQDAEFELFDAAESDNATSDSEPLAA